MTPRRLCAATLAAFLALATPAAAQDRVPGPVLLKRIAEAVDGDRSGERVWVVARYDSTSPVRGVLHDSASARALADRLGAAYGSFGPFSTVLDRTWMYIDPCPHDRVWSIFGPPMCPGPTRPPRGPIREPDVAEIQLVLRLRDGSTVTYPFAPTVDVIFLQMTAVDKFAIPYYSKIIGVDSAAQLRAQFQRVYAPR